MTIGISKQDLRVLFDKIHALDDSESLMALLDEAMAQCTELDPWLPIDENTPKDRNLLLINMSNLSCYIGYFDSLMGVWSVDFIPRHYKELTQDPKG